jgi:hypothetical protein
VPILFNYRHGIELTLKWLIRLAARCLVRAGFTQENLSPAIPERGVDDMRRVLLAQVAPNSPVAAARTLNRAVEDVPGDERKDNGIPAYADTQDHCWLMTWLFALRTVSLTRVEKWSSSPLLGTSSAVG